MIEEPTSSKQLKQIITDDPSMKTFIINEGIELEGQFEWGFTVVKSQSLLIMTGIGVSGEKVESSQNSVQVFIGPGMVKIQDEVGDENTKWRTQQFTANKQVPFPVKVSLNRNANTITFNLDGKCRQYSLSNSLKQKKLMSFIAAMGENVINLSQ